MNVLRILQHVLFICYLPKVIHTNEGKNYFYLQGQKMLHIQAVCKDTVDNYMFFLKWNLKLLIYIYYSVVLVFAQYYFEQKHFLLEIKVHSYILIHASV